MTGHIFMLPMVTEIGFISLYITEVTDTTLSYFMMQQLRMFPLEVQDYTIEEDMVVFDNNAIPLSYIQNIRATLESE